MNWLALLLGWLACIIMFFVGYRLGINTGHMQGHACEADMQEIYAIFAKDDDDSNP